MDPSFTSYQPDQLGSKGLVYIGDKLLVYRRDGNTSDHPFEIDLPGGGPKGQESPFETFQREVAEEFGLHITPNDISATHAYTVSRYPGRTAYFFVAKLPAEAAKQIVFGNEGAEYLLIEPGSYLDRTDAWAFIQDEARRYIPPSTQG